MQKKLMDHAAVHPNIFLRNDASDMALHMDSNAAYLVLSKARSKTAGHLQFSNHPNGNHFHFLNGEILVVYEIYQHTVSLEAESETAEVL